jgi:hypothetical protein
MVTIFPDIEMDKRFHEKDKECHEGDDNENGSHGIY